MSQLFCNVNLKLVTQAIMNLVCNRFTTFLSMPHEYNRVDSFMEIFVKTMRVILTFSTCQVVLMKMMRLTTTIAITYED